MDLVCQRWGTTKAFKGKGEVLRLARQAGIRADEVVGDMLSLAAASKSVPGTRFHYLALRRRPTPCGEACRLRWRNPLHEHVRWQQVVQDLKRLPLGLHDVYLAMNVSAQELNALHALYSNEHRVLARLAHVYDTAGDDRAVRCAPAMTSGGKA